MSTPCFKGLDTLASTIVSWQRQYGRHHLPWQGTHDPYRIWLSEIMLQQTQVATVVGYYERFLQRFPTVSALAQASLDDVMPYWAGLGYYARARNLHRCAQTVHNDHGGHFPRSSLELATLPGIGRSTASAIAAFAHGERSPIMDGNVKRVFTRYFGIYGETARRAVETQLWDTAEKAVQLAPESLDMRAYTQGLMDLGSTVCKRRNPECTNCPIRTDCYAYRHHAQHSLPQPRTRKPLPQRHCIMLILEYDGQVMLELQPSPGIWGGLWSLPRFDDAAELDLAWQHWQMGTATVDTLNPLVHTFSHFRLHIEPRHVKADVPPSVISDSTTEQAWVPIDQLPAMALPAPVKTLLDGAFSRSTCDAGIGL